MGEWGGPMSRDDFKKWQCHMLVSFIFPYPMSNLRNGIVACHYISVSPVACP